MKNYFLQERGIITIIIIHIKSIIFVIFIQTQLCQKANTNTYIGSGSLNPYKTHKEPSTSKSMFSAFLMHKRTIFLRWYYLSINDHRFFVVKKWRIGFDKHMVNETKINQTKMYPTTRDSFGPPLSLASQRESLKIQRLVLLSKKHNTC